MAATDTALRQRLEEYVDRVWVEGDLDAVEEYVDPEYVEHHLFGEYATLEGIEEHRRNVEQFVSAFSDLELEFERIVVDGDRTAQLFTCRGVHDGEFMGAPPTGNRVECLALGITDWEDGMMVEDWSMVDVMTIMEQLGLAGEP